MFFFVFLAATFPSIRPGDSRDYISLITNSFFNDFAFIVQYSSEINSTLIRSVWYASHDRQFLHVCILQENLLFST